MHWLGDCEVCSCGVFMVGESLEMKYPQLHRSFLRFHRNWQFVELLATNPARDCTTSRDPTGRGERKDCLLGLVFASLWSVWRWSWRSSSLTDRHWAMLSTDLVNDVRLAAWAGWNANNPQPLSRAADCTEQLNALCPLLLALLILEITLHSFPANPIAASQRARHGQIVPNTKKYTRLCLVPPAVARPASSSKL